MTVDEHTPESTTPVDGVVEVIKPIDRIARDRGSADMGLQDAAQELGARIKAARDSTNMSVEAAAELLKLLPATITALESGELDMIGEKRLIYIEGYYRAYANALDVDIADTRFAVDHARPIEAGAELGAQINYQSTTKKLLTERLRERSDAIIFGLVAVMVLVVGGVIWLVWPSADDLVGPGATGVVVAPSDPLQTQSASDELPFYLRDEPTTTTEDESAVSVSTPDAIATSDSVDATEELLVDGVDFVEEDIVDDVETTSIADPPSAAVNEVDEVPESAPPIQETGVIVITFSGSSWVEVYGANDERLYYQMGQDGEIASLVGLIPFTVRIGDASVVDVRFNGIVVDLAPHTFGNVANLTLE